MLFFLSANSYILKLNYYSDVASMDKALPNSSGSEVELYPGVVQSCVTTPTSKCLNAKERGWVSMASAIE
jgi:hypothetical protein